MRGTLEGDDEIQTENQRKARKREHREKREKKKNGLKLKGVEGRKSRPEAVRGQRGPFLSAV